MMYYLVFLCKSFNCDTSLPLYLLNSPRLCPLAYLFCSDIVGIVFVRLYWRALSMLAMSTLCPAVFDIDH